MKNNVVIIAEAGVNHNGSVELAKKLIDAAYQAGADYVKFQTFKTELSVSKSASKAEYQIENTGLIQETQFEMVKKLELSFEDFTILQEYAEAKPIGFLSTGFDLESIDFLADLGIDFFKIPSGEITNLPLLRKIASKRKTVVLSSGMANLEEISAAINVLVEGGVNLEQITVLHCNTEYPTPMADVNLGAMNTIATSLGVKIGYSDHTLGIEVPVAAVAMGATIIEKHFTLDKGLPGPDHLASLEPMELKAMVDSIRNIELAISGNKEKKPSFSEIKNRPIVRKSLHYKKNFPQGHVLREDDLLSLRPGTGISPMKIDSIIGRKLVRNVSEFSQLDINDII
jgi:N,N'-diacetyllegionaminate synthase